MSLLFRRRALLIVGAALLFVLGGCDTSFEPFVEGGVYYSIHGYLHPDSTMQAVRVELLRDGEDVTVNVPLPEGTEVTLTHLGSGRAVALRDSFYALPGGAEVNLYYTAEMPVAYEGRYRLRVEGPAGDAEGAATVAATAETTVPPPMPPVDDIGRIDIDPASCGLSRSPRSVLVEVPPIKHLVAATARYSNGVTSSHLNDTTRTSGGGYRVEITWTDDVGPCPGSGVFSVTLGSGSGDWPPYEGIDEPGTTAGRPETTSNVEGGVGYFGAATTRVIYGEFVRPEVPGPRSSRAPAP